MACRHGNLGATGLPPLGHMRQYGHSKVIDNINTFHVIILYVYFKRSFFGMETFIHKDFSLSNSLNVFKQCIDTFFPVQYASAIYDKKINFEYKPL